MKRLITVVLLITLFFVFAEAKMADNNNANVSQDNKIRYENPLKDFKPLYKGKTIAPMKGNPDIIKLGFQNIDVKKGEPKIAPELRVDNSKSTEGYYIVQFNDKVRENYKDQLKARGIILEWPIKYNGFIVKASSNAINSIKGLSFINWVSDYHPAYKVNNKWLERKSSNTQEFIISLYKSADMNKVIDQLNALGIEITEKSSPKSLLKKIGIRTTYDRLIDVVRIDDVFFVNVRFKQYPKNNVGRAVVMEGSTTDADTTLWEHGIYGSGEIINVTDSGVTVPHYAFYDGSVALTTWGHYPTHRKIIAYLPSIPGYEDTISFGDDSNQSYHGSHTTGTVAGDDSPFATAVYDGVAKDAKIFFLDCGNNVDNFLWIPMDLYGMFDTMYTNGARITSNSYGAYNDSLGGAYMDNSQSIDAYTWDHKDFNIFYSAGNSGSNAQTISPAASAKNVVSVGSVVTTSPNSVSTFSSRGPTEDGRWGVTVMGPGESLTSVDGGTSGTGSNYVSMQGTSMSCPIIAGSAALVRDWLKQGFYPTGTAIPDNAITDPSSALVRALLINSADDMGQTIPNTDIGFGRVVLYNALFLNDVAPKAIALHDAKAGLLQDEYVDYEFNITDGSSDLKVTLVWTDYPYPFTGYNNQMQDSVLLNDLDLIVTSPSGTVYDLNDILNPMEQIIDTLPETGVWKIRVLASNIVVSPQPYAIVVSYNVNNAFNGSITFDQPVYSVIDSIAKISVTDNDSSLATAGSLNVMVYSMMGDTEYITCTGTTGLFTGQITLDYELDNNDGSALRVKDNDTIWAIYDDQEPVQTVKAMARIDGKWFTIYNVHTETVEGTRAFIAWNTTEEATGKVYYGTTTSLGSETAVNPNLVKDHSGDFAIELSNLTSNTIYYYDVESTDNNGNTVRDDNGGKHYMFATVDMSSTDILVIVTDMDLQGELFAHPDFLVQAIEDGGWTYSWWQTSVNNFGMIPVDNLLKKYKAIFLQSGQENYPPVNDNQQDSLERYEQGGGRIAYTGHDFGWAMASTDGFNAIGTDQADSLFVINYMMGQYWFDLIDQGNFTIYGVSGDPISGAYTAGVPYNPYRSGADGDLVYLVNNAFVAGTADSVWLWDDGTNVGICGTRWESTNPLGTSGDGVWGGYRTRVVYNAFEITQIDTSNATSATRSDILNKDLIWLIGHDHPDVTISAPLAGQSFSASPISIEWTQSADAASGAYIDSVYIYYSPNGGDVWYEITKGTASEVASPYSWDVSTLLNGTDYMVKVKVVDGGVLPSMGGVDIEGPFTIDILGNDTEGPVVFAGSIQFSVNPVGNISPGSPTNTLTVTAIICDSTSGMSTISEAEWSYGSNPAPAGSGYPMTAVDGAFDEIYEVVTATITVDTTWGYYGNVPIFVRGRDGSAAKSPLNWGEADYSLLNVINTANNSNLTFYTGIYNIALTANSTDGTVTLEWVDNSQCNSYYVIEKKAKNAKDFEAIANINCKLGQSNYEYTDKNVEPGHAYYYRIVSVSNEGTKIEHPEILILVNGVPRPTTYYLAQNYPNPFKGATLIEYAIPVQANVELNVYDITGKLIKTLVNGMQDARYYKIRWDGTDNVGNKVSAGVYFYRLKSGDFERSMKMMLLK